MADIQLGHARKDERGQTQGGAPGDQNGLEVSISGYYHPKDANQVKHPWTHILRAVKTNGSNDYALQQEIATQMVKACNNDKIGYDQNDRLTFYQALLTQLGRGSVDISTITDAVECDCSSCVRAIVTVALYKQSKISTFSSSSPLNSSDRAYDDTLYRDMKSFTWSTGKFVDVDPLATYSGEGLQIGDILFQTITGHVAVIVSMNGEISTHNVQNSLYNVVYVDKSGVPRGSTKS